MSKFDYNIFYGGYDDFAASKEKYTKEQAVTIARIELAHRKHKYLFVGQGYVRHRAGINEDNEPCVGWWLEYIEHKRSCPCWVFHTSDLLDANYHNGYEVLKLHNEECVDNE